MVTDPADVSSVDWVLVAVTDGHVQNFPLGALLEYLETARERLQ